MNARRPLRLIALALVAVVGVSACASTPSAKRIALDSVETLDVDESVKECMREFIENADQDEVQEWAEAADAGDTTDLARFEGRLRACRTSG